MPAGWKQALESLVAATAREGLPWSCPGGYVALSVDPGGAEGQLTVKDAQGRETSRLVQSPEEVGPTGKALLAEAVLVAPAVAPAPATPAPLAPPRADVARPPGDHPIADRPRAPLEPRLLLDALAGARFSGPSATAWLSASVRAAIPIGRWSVGLYTRADLPIVYPDDIVRGFSMTSVSVGFSGGRSFSVGPLELRASLIPSLAVVRMEAEKDDDESKPHPEGSRAAIRIGSELGVTFRIARILRAMVALDGEMAPAELSSSPPLAAGFPTQPAYTLGISLGLEAVIR